MDTTLRIFLAQYDLCVGDVDGNSHRVLEAASAAAKRHAKEPAASEQFLVIIECKNEREQVDILRACKKSGWKCSAKIS